MQLEAGNLEKAEKLFKAALDRTEDAKVIEVRVDHCSLILQHTLIRLNSPANPRSTRFSRGTASEIRGPLADTPPPLRAPHSHHFNRNRRLQECIDHHRDETIYSHLSFARLSKLVHDDS